MTARLENGQPYSPALAFVAGAAITVGPMLAVRELVEKLKRKEEKGIGR